MTYRPFWLGSGCPQRQKVSWCNSKVPKLNLRLYSKVPTKPNPRGPSSVPLFLKSPPKPNPPLGSTFVTTLHSVPSSHTKTPTTLFRRSTYRRLSPYKTGYQDLPSTVVPEDCLSTVVPEQETSETPSDTRQGRGPKTTGVRKEPNIFGGRVESTGVL